MVAPPSSERSTPPERLPAYTISGCREENIEVGRDVASRPAGFVAAGTWSANQQRSQDQECLPHVNILSAALRAAAGGHPTENQRAFEAWFDANAGDDSNPEQCEKLKGARIKACLTPEPVAGAEAQRRTPRQSPCRCFDSAGALLPRGYAIRLH